MGTRDRRLGVSRILLRGSFVLACAGWLLLGSPANAGTVLQYGQLNPSDMVTATDNGAGTTTLTTTGNIDGGNFSIPVVITNFLGTPFPNGFAAFVTYVDVQSVGPAGIDPFSGAIEQKFSGKIEFSSGINGTGANYLTVVFSAFTLSPILGGAPAGTGATLQATQPPDSLVFTSSFATFGPITSMAIGFSNISPSLSIAGDGSLASFTAQDAGTFGANSVPEPSTFCLASFAVVIGTFAAAYRRMRMKA
jgi:hypothetical protein